MKAAKKKRTRKSVTKVAPNKRKTSKKKHNKKHSMNNKSSGKKSLPEGESVGKIRDILFGEQMADYEERFAALEASLRTEVAELKKGLTDEMRQSVSELKALVQKEKEESNDRNVARRQLADRLQKVVDDLRK